METKIHGSTLPVLEVTLQAGEKLVAEGGELSWMSPNINLHTSTSGLGQGGVFGAIKRAASGSTIFLTEYTAQGGVGQVAFATKLPGSILPINVIPDRFLVQRHGFLCATGDVDSPWDSSAGSIRGSSAEMGSDSRRSRERASSSWSCPVRWCRGIWPRVSNCWSIPATSGSFRPACPSRSPLCPGSPTRSSAATVASWFA